MRLGELVFGQVFGPPADLLEGRVRDDERVQDHVRIAEAALQFLDRAVEANLGIIWSFKISDALRIDERDVLLVVGQQPEQEVGVEVPGLEEADAPTSAHVAKQVKFPVLEERWGCVIERAKIGNELLLAFVQRDRADIHEVALEVQERLVEVLAE